MPLLSSGLFFPKGGASYQTRKWYTNIPYLYILVFVGTQIGAIVDVLFVEIEGIYDWLLVHMWFVRIRMGESSFNFLRIQPTCLSIAKRPLLHFG